MYAAEAIAAATADAGIVHQFCILAATPVGAPDSPDVTSFDDFPGVLFVSFAL